MTDNTLRILAESELAKTVLQEADEASVKRRRELLDQIDQLQQERAAANAEHDNLIAAAEAQVVHAEQELEHCRRSLTQLRCEQRSQLSDFTGRIDGLHADLIESAPAEFSTTISDLHHRAQLVRSELRTETHRKRTLKGFEETQVSNVAEIEGRVDEILKAVRDLEAMAESEVPDSRLSEALREARQRFALDAMPGVRRVAVSV